MISLPKVLKDGGHSSRKASRSGRVELRETHAGPDRGLFSGSPKSLGRRRTMERLVAPFRSGRWCWGGTVIFLPTDAPVIQGRKDELDTSRRPIARHIQDQVVIVRILGVNLEVAFDKAVALAIRGLHLPGRLLKGKTPLILHHLDAALQGRNQPDPEGGGHGEDFGRPLADNHTFPLGRQGKQGRD